MHLTISHIYDIIKPEQIRELKMKVIGIVGAAGCTVILCISGYGFWQTSMLAFADPAYPTCELFSGACAPMSIFKGNVSIAGAVVSAMVGAASVALLLKK
jgi:hypothetical protein